MKEIKYEEGVGPRVPCGKRAEAVGGGAFG